MAAGVISMQDHVNTCTWNGEKAMNISVGWDPQRPEKQRGGIANLPQNGLALLRHWAWTGWWVFERPFHTGIVDLIEQGDVMPPVLTNDERTRWIIRSKYPMDQTELVIEASRASDGSVCLRRVVQQSYRSREAYEHREESQLMVVSTIEYSTEPAGVTASLPASATLHIQHIRPQSSESSWAKAHITVRDARPVNIDDSTFILSFAADAIVADERYAIAYALGSNEMEVEGRLFQTELPLHGDVGDNIEWWMNRGRFISD